MSIQAHRKLSTVDDMYVLEVGSKVGLARLIARSTQERKAIARELIAAAEFFLEGIKDETT